MYLPNYKIGFEKLCRTCDVWDYHYYWERKGGQHYMYMHGTYNENERGYFWASKEKKAQSTISFEVDKFLNEFICKKI